MTTTNNVTKKLSILVVEDAPKLSMTSIALGVLQREMSPEKLKKILTEALQDFQEMGLPEDLPCIKEIKETLSLIQGIQTVT